MSKKTSQTSIYLTAKTSKRPKIENTSHGLNKINHENFINTKRIHRSMTVFTLGYSN